TLVERNIRRWAEITGLKERYINDGFEKGIDRGIERGRKEGIERGALLTAKKGLTLGYKVDEIEKLTGLTKKQIEKIAKELGKGN
ncbi:MAG: hypothetical protein QG635_1307, partial [Bacteroidota bacterium]|nr:hypothetical protein [Bacteroidota bacterium]